MPEKPLLIFPEYTTAVRQSEKPSFGASPYHYPVFANQKDRLTPQFESMLQSYIVDIPEGLEPEYVLVIETIGQVEDFQRAVSAIDGLEWLAEIDEERIEPDRVFYQNCKIGKRFLSNKIEYIKSKQSSEIWQSLLENGFVNNNGYLTDKDISEFEQFIPDEFSGLTEEIITTLKNELLTSAQQVLSGRLFLSMSNRQAMEKLLNLWNQWDSSDKKLPRPYGKWTEIFKHLKVIRKWDTQDRLRETGIREFWENELELKRGTSSRISFDIEFWYRNDGEKRSEIQAIFSDLVSQEDGNIVTFCEIEEIRFHAIRAELPLENIEKAINAEYGDIFYNENIKYFRPIGQCKVELSNEGAERDFEAGSATGDPVVAILDGMPFANHTLLENRLILDDPDNFESAYSANERNHGTAMASLVCHGELDAQEDPLSRLIYFRPIMKPDSDDSFSIPKPEIIPKEFFIEDIILRSVRRIFEGDSGEDAIAPTIKVINISLGDPSKMFFNELSSCAKLLDWLSYKYQVLFCVSAGNISTDINLEKNVDEIRSLLDKDLVNLTITKIYEDIRNRRMISPADSINALTLGAVHSDMSTIDNIGDRVDILPNQNLPSPISAHGLGYRNSIKPELYIAGGRQLYRTVSGGQYTVLKSGRTPGQCTAAVSQMVGERNRYTYTVGTSNSAALASRAAAKIYEMLDELLREHNITIDNNIAVILKALLVHGASWGDRYSLYGEILKQGDNSRNLRKNMARYMGYGVPDFQRVLECTSQRATAIGYGKIKENERHDYRFPLPPSLSGVNEMRRLTITLAWFSPINAANRKYRRANLSFVPPVDSIGVKRVNSDGRQVKNGTVHHEVFEGNSVVSYQDGEFLMVSVVCRGDAGRLDEEINYGIVVTLEITEGIELPIYEEIKNRINIPVQVEEQIE